MNDLNWTVEEACLNSRPSPLEMHFNGWLIRASGGPVRRTNSVNPTKCRTNDYIAVINEAERIYESLKRPSIFKVLTIADGIDTALADRGYGAQAETRVLLAPFGMTAMPTDGAEVIVGAPTEDWIEAWATADGITSEVAINAFRGSVGNIVLPKAFACRRVNGRPVSIAYGVICQSLLVLEAVATHSDHRGRGYAFHVVSSLMRWAEGMGTEHACLAVVADNVPALALYRSLGFERELYRYHYRRNDLQRQN